MGAPSSRCGQESRAVDKGFLLDVTLSDPLQGLPPMNPMVAIATWTTCGPRKGGAGAVGAALRGGRWRFFPLALPLTLPLARQNAGGSQPASHTSTKYSSQTAAKQQPNSGDPRPVAFLRSLRCLLLFPILCHVAGSAAATEQWTPSSLGQSSRVSKDNGAAAL
jgi:hypothetical protein